MNSKPAFLAGAAAEVISCKDQLTELLLPGQQCSYLQLVLGQVGNQRKFRHLHGKYARRAGKQWTFAEMFHCKALRIPEPGIC